jgi:hypothetical protein
MLDRRNVLDQDGLGTEDLGGTRDQQVEVVAGVITPRVVVQIRVTLAWWSGEQNVHGSDLRSKSCLARGRQRTNGTVDESGDIRFEYRCFGKVAREHLRGIGTLLDRENDISAVSHASCSLGHA